MMESAQRIVNNIFQAIKLNYPNVYMFSMATIITLWFSNINRIASKLLPEGELWYNFAFVAITTWLLYIGDGSLNELYSGTRNNALTTAATQQQIKEDTDFLNKIRHTRRRK